MSNIVIQTNGLSHSYGDPIINADAVSLADGVEQLREIAGLPSISKAVPVSFVLQFVGG